MDNIIRLADKEGSDAKNRMLGLQGELLVVQWEKQQLQAAGRDDLAERVDHVAVTKGDGLGYDVRSYTEDGLEKYIEVKTTRGLGLLHIGKRGCVFQSQF